MEAYFQFLGFSMEPHGYDQEPPITWSPIYLDSSGLGNMTTMVYPLFVAPKCSNGTTGNGKVLVAVIGKDVTLDMLKADGLNEKQTARMINDNLATVRKCSQEYNYSSCKLQSIRKTAAECPSAPPKVAETGSSETCFLLKDTYYVLNKTATPFLEAAKNCADLGGRLAEFDPIDLPDLEGNKTSKLVQHFLGSASPPDGAWIGLQPEGTGNNKWVWIGSRKKISNPELRLWINGPQKGLACHGGFVDPRGTLYNVGAKLCHEKTAFWCEFDAKVEDLPASCKLNVTVVDPDDVMKGTTDRCVGTETCVIDRSLDNHDEELDDIICDPGDPEEYPPLVCCSRTDVQAFHSNNTCAFQDMSEDLSGVVLDAPNRGVISLNTTTEGPRSDSTGNRSSTSPQVIGLSVALGVASLVAISAVLLRWSRHSDQNIQIPLAQIPMGDGVMRKQLLVSNPSPVSDSPNGSTTSSRICSQPPLADRELSFYSATGESHQSETAGLGGPSSGSRRWTGSVLFNGSSIESPFTNVPREPGRGLLHPPAVPGNERSGPIVPIQNVKVLHVGGWKGKGSHGNVQEGVWEDEQGKMHKVAVKSARDLAGQ
eukprot:evm.model.scf_2226.1 EVM.evm.TU.scf_2226.1   scf_2226:15937-21372(-)